MSDHDWADPAPSLAHTKAMAVALARSTPPEGHATWTMQLLADKLVEIKVVDTISGETVRRMLKKTS